MYIILNWVMAIGVSHKGGTVMSRRRLLAVLAATLLVISVGALAQNIDTTPSWNGTDAVGNFGYPDTATYGQTVTAPAAGASLTTFTFYMKLPASCTFQGEVYAWDGAKATGAPLWEGPATQTLGSGNFEAITFTPGGVALAPSTQYVLFASVSKLSGSGLGPWGLTSSDAYPGGAMVYINNGSDPSLWTSTSWSRISARDLAFKANFNGASAPGLTVAPVSTCAGAMVVPLSITPTLTVTDGSEVLGNILISGVPAGATLSAGTDKGSGTWMLTPAQLAGLTINLPAGATSFALSVQASEAKQTGLVPEADSFVDSSSPSSNYGALGQLQVLTYSYTWDSYLRYNLSALPPGISISDALFTIIFFNGYAYGGDGNHYLFFVPDDTWAEMGITWNNRPAYTTNLGYWWPWNNNTPRYWLFSVDVTPTVQAEYAGDKKVSFCIHNGGSYSGYYYSRETGTTNSPKLLVNYDPAYTTEALPVTLASVILAPSSLPGGIVGTTYNQTLTASGGTAPYTYAVTAGALPAGLALSLGGVLSGTPTASGSFGFTVTATDANSCTRSQAYSIYICPIITITPAALPETLAGVYYSQTITASGGTAPYTYVVTAGALPSGLALSSGGVLSGTPTVSGGFSFTVTATDANSCTGSQTYSFYVQPYNLSLLDDLRRSQVCVNSVTGAWQYTVLSGAGMGTYTGTGTATGSVAMNPLQIMSSPSSPYRFTLTYWAPRGTASATFRSGGFNSSLSDRNTKDDPPCGETKPAS